MSSPASGVLRLTRATVLGGATVGLSLAAHVAGGGSSPTPVGLALLTLPVLAVTLLVTGRRLSGAGVAALVGAGQIGLHLGLTALTASTAVRATQGGASEGGATVGGDVGHHLLHLTLGVAPGRATPPAGAGPGAGLGAVAGAVGPMVLMSLAHLAAAALVALVLTRGEQALWSLLGWLLPRLPGAPRTPVGARRAPVVAAGSSYVSPPRGGRRSRAPPSGPAAVLERLVRGPGGRRPAVA